MYRSPNARPERDNDHVEIEQPVLTNVEQAANGLRDLEVPRRQRHAGALCSGDDPLNVVRLRGWT